MSQIFVLKTLSGELRGTYYFLMAGMEGIEPSIHGLTVRRSTAELHPHISRF